MKTLIIAFAVVIVVLLGILAFYNPAKGPTLQPTMSAMVMSPDGHAMVTLPVANATVTSPLAIQGVVVGGGWFFEATFPVKVLDANGTVIGHGMAQALSDWMSTGTVPFSASIAFTQPTTATGSVVFSKDNPSGLSANDESFSMPVAF